MIYLCMKKFLKRSLLIYSRYNDIIKKFYENADAEIVCDIVEKMYWEIRGVDVGLQKDDFVEQCTKIWNDFIPKRKDKKDTS